LKKRLSQRTGRIKGTASKTMKMVALLTEQIEEEALSENR
jgi:hypothetical protein